MDRIVNWLILLIVLVFDPLAVCLLITASSILMQIKPKEVVADKIFYSVPPLSKEEEDIAEVNYLKSQSIEEEKEPLEEEQPEYELTDEEEEIIAANPDQPVSFNQLKAMTADQRKEYLKGLGKV